MAIQKTLQLTNHLTAADAYIRVDTVSGYKGRIDASVNVYLSQAAFAGQTPFVKPGATPADPMVPDPQPYLEQIMLNFVPDASASAKNFIEQAYVALKALPRFSGAINV